MIQIGSYFGREPIKRTEVEVRVAKLKNGKATGKDEVTREMIKVGGDKWWTGFGSCVISLFRVVLCRKTGDHRCSLHCTRVKEGGQNVAFKEV